MQIVIAKEKTSPVPKDPRKLAGHEAEKQMAFYLRRAFGDDPDVLVFNDLRLVRNGEAAQIDHLVLHRFGFAIVESKSVVGELVVNQHGEFARIWGKKREGMHSPIKQAQLQAELLSKLLNDHKETLRRKLLFGTKQGFFGEERFQVYAAVSDSGRITRENCDPEELCKADTVAEKIKANITKRAKANITGVGGFVKYMTAGSKGSQQMLDDYLPALTDEELSRVQAFLLSQDTPRFAASSSEIVEAELVELEADEEIVELLPMDDELTSPTMQTASAVTAATGKQPALNTGRCKQCSGSNLKIVHGRYGYYYKCQDCDGNTPIDLTCTHCGEKARVTKSKLEFSRDCAQCGEKVLFHVNDNA